MMVFSTFRFPSEELSCFLRKVIASSQQGTVSPFVHLPCKCITNTAVTDAPADTNICITMKIPEKYS